MSKEVDEIVALFTQFRSKCWIPDTRLQGWEQQEFDLAIAEFQESLNDNNMLPINVYPAYSRPYRECIAKSASEKSSGSFSTQVFANSAYCGNAGAKHTTNRWLPEENRKLEALYLAHPDATWAELARLLQTKTAKQCCQYWHRVIRAEKKGRWSPEEDKALIAQLSSNTEPSVNGRSRLQVSNRIKILLRRRNQ